VVLCVTPPFQNKTILIEYETFFNKSIDCCENYSPSSCLAKSLRIVSRQSIQDDENKLRHAKTEFFFQKQLSRSDVAPSNLCSILRGDTVSPDDINNKQPIHDTTK
jgi:hypothetical protein